MDSNKAVIEVNVGKVFQNLANGNNDSEAKSIKTDIAKRKIVFPNGEIIIINGIKNF